MDVPIREHLQKPHSTSGMEWARAQHATTAHERPVHADRRTPATVAAAAGEPRKDVSIMDENVIPNEIQTVWTGTAEAARALGAHRQTTGKEEQMAKRAPRRIHSINETAELLGVSRNTVVRMLESGRIGHAAKVGGRWRINARAEWPQLFPEKEGL